MIFSGGGGGGGGGMAHLDPCMTGALIEIELMVFKVPLKCQNTNV